MSAILNFKTGRFQGASFYQGLNGKNCIVSSISGRFFKIDPVANTVADITLQQRNPNNEKCWFTQAEQFLIAQDNQSPAWIYWGAGSRLSDPTKKEVPTGGPMAYWGGRLWVAKGREYWGSNIVGGEGGTPAFFERDSVLHFTENTFLNEGGSFSVPALRGNITAMTSLPNLNTQLGQADLVVFVEDAVFFFSVPFDRTIWKDMTYPAQRYGLDHGTQSDTSVVPVNSDLWFQSDDGIRSLKVAVRDFEQPGESPLSYEVSLWLDRDDELLAQFGSGALFDNWLMYTCSPARSQRGIYHRGMTVIDITPSTSLLRRKSPVWEGLWTGLDILQIVTGKFDGRKRCFMFTVNTQQEIELWEFDPTTRFDNGSDRITMRFESSKLGFGQPDRFKKLHEGELYVDELDGRTNFLAQYRPDRDPRWQDWHEWSECATMSDCTPTTICTPPKPLVPQWRFPMQLPEPNEDCDDVTGKPFKTGYEFQFALEMTGYARVCLCNLFAEARPEELRKPCLATEPCKELESCEFNPFTYNSQATDVWFISDTHQYLSPVVAASVHTEDVANLVNSINLQAVIGGGDNSFADQIANLASLIPDYVSSHSFFPVIGNHDLTTAAGIPDGGAAFLAYYTWMNGHRFYNVRIGSVEFFMMEWVTGAPGGMDCSGTQWIWLQSAVAASSAPWKIIVGHFPPYSSGSTHGSTPAIQCDFATAGMDLILSGHEHNYERGVDSHGTPWIVSGVGGSALYPFGPPVAGSSVRDGAFYGALRIQANATTLTITALDVTATQRDQLVLTK